MENLLVEFIFWDQVKAILNEGCVWRGSGVCNQIKIDCGKRIRVASDEAVPFFACGEVDG